MRVSLCSVGASEYVYEIKASRMFVSLIIVKL